MIHEYEVYNLIKDILSEFGYECEIKYISSGFYSCMTYVPESNVIKFNHYNINGTHHKLFKKIDIYDFTKVITYHEIGHIIDAELNGYMNRSKFEMELAAWKQSDKIIPKHMESDYLDIKERHMEYQHNKLR